MEGKLIDKVGQLGKKLHTGRSRNDQVATDLKLWCKEMVSELLAANRQLQSALVETAQNNQDAVMPGYTHLQRAQPVTFAHWCLAYVEMLARDESRLQDALKRLDVSPLGCGALAGTAYDIDREQLAGWLGLPRQRVTAWTAFLTVITYWNCFLPPPSAWCICRVLPKISFSLTPAKRVLSNCLIA